MKTKEEILKSNLKNISCLNADGTFNSVCKAMQEYADQSIAEYKAKLKEDVICFIENSLSSHLLSISEIEKLIDTTYL